MFSYEEIEVLTRKKMDEYDLERELVILAVNRTIRYADRLDDYLNTRF